MRRRFVQDPKTGKLHEVKPPAGPSYGGGTFQAGDIPDMMKDVKRNKADIAKRFAEGRKRSLIDAVNKHTGA